MDLVIGLLVRNHLQLNPIYQPVVSLFNYSLDRDKHNLDLGLVENPQFCEKR
jgi:hypothetical protein